MGCPTDISREQFGQIREILESARKKTKPREVGLYDVFCGLLYVPKEGHKWRMPPKGYPKWRAAHEYFLTWSEKAACGQPSVLGRP
jgi:transposase